MLNENAHDRVGQEQRGILFAHAQPFPNAFHGRSHRRKVYQVGFHGRGNNRPGRECLHRETVQ
jgi:hypothetical protein